jgi:hypothetical protein
MGFLSRSASDVHGQLVIGTVVGEVAARHALTGLDDTSLYRRAACRAPAVVRTSSFMKWSSAGPAPTGQDHVGSAAAL